VAKSERVDKGDMAQGVKESDKGFWQG